MAQSGGCESCATSGVCKAVSGDRVLMAENKIGAKPGQHVFLKIESGAFLKASFLVYMLPVIFLFLGAWARGEFCPQISGALAVGPWQALGGGSLPFPS